MKEKDNGGQLGADLRGSIYCGFSKAWKIFLVMIFVHALSGAKSFMKPSLIEGKMSNQIVDDSIAFTAGHDQYPAVIIHVSRLRSFLRLQACQWYNHHAIKTGVGIFAPGDYHKQIRLAERNLFFLFVMFPNKVC